MRSPEPNPQAAVDSASSAVPAPVARAGQAKALAPWLRTAALVAAMALVFAIVRNWERWNGDADEQRTDDATLQTDITPIASKVSGYVQEAPVGDFAAVRSGQLLVALVADDYRARLAQQDAAVATATAGLASNAAQTALQQANVRAAQAAMAGVEALLARNALEAIRQRQLVADGAGSAQAQETSEAAELQARAQHGQALAQLQAAQRQIGVIEAQRRQADAALRSAHAARDLALLDLSHTRIVAPEDGAAGARQVRAGQYVSIGQQVAVVAALPRLWVLANFKENQLRRMRPGQPCTLTIDAFPGRSLAGHVLGFAPGTGSQFALLPADNATGNFTKVVQRVGVKIGIDDAGDLRDLLRPGMSVVAMVSVGSASGR